MMVPWRRRRHDPAAGLGDLEAALRREGCPVCIRAEGADERWLDRFLDDGYLERDLMGRVAAGGGFCAFHAARIVEIGQSATVALIYLDLIADSLPRLTAAADRQGRPAPLFPAVEACAACAHQCDVERRECFFLALLILARGPRCYGHPSVVCLRHLPPLLEYLDDPAIGDILARHRERVAALDPRTPPIRPSARCSARRRTSTSLPRYRTPSAATAPIRFAGCAAACAVCRSARSAPRWRMPEPSGWHG